MIDPFDDPAVIAALQSIGRRRRGMCPRCTEAPVAPNSATGFCQPCTTEHQERIRASKRRSYHRRKQLPTEGYSPQRSTADEYGDVTVGEDGWRLLKVAEAAKLLGVAPSTIYELIRTGHLRSLKIAGRHRRVPADAIADLIRKAEEQEAS